MAEKASVENRPMAPITISAPAYQSRCARSKRGAGEAAARPFRKSSSGLSLLASRAPAVTAARKSWSVKCIESSNGRRQGDRKTPAAAQAAGGHGGSLVASDGQAVRFTRGRPGAGGKSGYGES